MALVKFQFKPGINKESTAYAADGGYVDSDKIRFRKGVPEKINGWTKNSTNSFVGTCRKIHNYSDTGLTNYTILGTHQKLYVKEGNAYNDITPIRQTTAAGDVTFAATENSSTLTVTDANHGASPGDFVTFSGAQSLGGNITAAVLNKEYQLQTTPTANTYTITATATATANDVGQSGGSNTVGTYQITGGLDVFVSGSGWGSGAWGAGGFGSTNPIALNSQLRIWTIDNFGEDTLAAPRGGPLYFWDESNGVTSRAVLASSLGGASDIPTSILQVMISDVDRHCIAFGANPIGSAVVDPLFVRWSDSESFLDWTPKATNSAGGVKLSSGSQIIGAIPTRQETLVFTDTSVVSMRFVGSPFYFSFNEVATGLGMIGPNAGIAIGTAVYFMDDGAFYKAEGSVGKLPCTVLDYVFSDFNQSQKYKVFAANNSAYNEIIWFYPSSTSNEIDRYVSYNYLENAWAVGTTTDGYTRTAWSQAPTLDFPLAAGKLDNTNLNYLYNQEDGNLADGSGFTSYVETADFDLDPAGEQLMFISKVIPDLKFLQSTSANDTVDFILRGRKYPLEDLNTLSTSSVTPSTTFVSTRGRSRQSALKIQSTSGDFGWRLGDLRLDIRADGEK